MAPQHPQSAPSSNPRPLPGQPSDQADILQDDMFPSTSVAGNRQVHEDWENMRLSVENPAARDQLQDQQYVAMGYYDMSNDYSSPYRHHDYIIPDYARIVQNVPIHAHVVPPAPVIDAFNDDVQQAGAGPAPAFLDEVPHRDPVLNGRSSEVLRQLALLYLNEPNSQLTMSDRGHVLCSHQILHIL